MPLIIQIEINDLGSVNMTCQGDTRLLAKQALCVGSRLGELIDNAELDINPAPRNVLESYLATRDPVVEQVIDLLRVRSRRGMAKYGVGLDRQDLTDRDWLVHLMEELADALNYAQCRLNEFNRQRPTTT